MRTERPLAVAAAAACVVIWGTTFIATKMLLGDMGPVGILLVRTLLGTAALFAICRGRMPQTSARAEWLMAGAGLTGVCLYFVLENVALQYTTASNVSVIVSVSPLLTGLLSWWFLRAGKPRWNFYVGFACAITGIWFVSGGPTSVAYGMGGDLLALLAALCWAVYSILVRCVGQMGLPVASVTRRIFVYGLAFLIAAFFMSGETVNLSVFASPPAVLNLLFLGLGASAFCFFAWNYAVGVLGPVQTTGCLYAVPVITVVLAAIILGERLDAAGAAGIALTLGGMFVAQWEPVRRGDGAARGGRPPERR